MSNKYKQYKQLKDDSKYQLEDDGKIYTGKALKSRFPSTKFYEFVDEPITELPEVIVTPPSNPFEELVERNIAANKPQNEAIRKEYDRISDPIFGQSRVTAYQKAMNENPNFSRDWDMAANIGEHLNATTGGLLNRISPTQNARFVYDLFKGNPVFDYNNSWWGNSGIVSDDFAQQHPYISLAVNGLTDIATAAGVPRFYRYANTPKLIGEGAEARVYAKPFSRYVYKYADIEPEQMALKNQVPYFAKNKYMGMSDDNLHIYRQSKLNIPNNPDVEFRQIVKGLTHKHNYNPFTHEFLEGLGLRNGDYVLSDFGKTGAGQIGRTWFTRRPRIIDMAVETVDDFNEAMEGW